MAGEVSKTFSGGPTRAAFHRDLAIVAALLGAHVAMALLIPVHHDFPIGDSWSFAWSSRELVDHGRVRLNDIQGMNLVAQLVLAWPAGMLFGSDPAVLNDFTFVLSAATLVIFYSLLRVVGLSSAPAAFAVFTLFANPIWLAQSLSFETEIPFLFLGILGAFLLLRWDRAVGGSASYWGAWICFAAAALIRQHGLVFSLAGAGYAAWVRPARRAPAAPICLPIIGVACFYVWLSVGPGVPKAFTWHQNLLLGELTQPAAFILRRLAGVVEAVNYLGLFFLPLAPLLVWTNSEQKALRSKRSTSLAFAAVLGAATLILLLGLGWAMPYLPNVLSLDSVLAPLGISPPFFWIPLTLTLVSYLGACATLGPAWTQRRELLLERPGSGDASLAARRFLLATAVLLLAFSLGTGLHFDRYLLVPLPFLAPTILAGAETSRIRLVVSSALLAASLLLAIIFADQRVYRFGCEWHAATGLVARGVAPLRIDGGNAFNGYYSYTELSENFGQSQPDPWPAWIHPTAEYVVRTFEIADPRVSEIQQSECRNHWGFAPLRAYIYRRTAFEGPPLPNAIDAAR